MMAAAVCMFMTACKGKADQANAESEAEAEATEQVADDEQTPAQEVDMDALSDYTVCPFCLQDRGRVDADGNPVTVDRQWICGSTVGANNIAEWVLLTQDPRFAFNVDGWHFVGKDIVNADESYKINDEDAQMSLSSFCTIRTEPYTKPAEPEHYDPVRFMNFRALDPDYSVPDIKISGNHHGEVEPNGDQVQSAYYLQEWVTVTMPADKGITLAVVPYELIHGDFTFDDEKLASAIWSGKPEANDDGTVSAQFYISEEQPAGCYDLLLIRDAFAIARLTMVMTKE